MKRVHGRMNRLAAALVDHRRWVLGAIAVIAIVMAAGLPRLKSDFTVDELFADVGNQRQVTNELREQFGNTDNVLLIVVEAPPGGTVGASLPAIAALSLAAGSIEGVEAVNSITTIPIVVSQGAVIQPIGSNGPSARIDAKTGSARIHAAMASPLLRGQLISEDGRVAVIALELEKNVTRAERLAAVVDSADALIAAHPRWCFTDFPWWTSIYPR